MRIILVYSANNSHIIFTQKILIKKMAIIHQALLCFQNIQSSIPANLLIQADFTGSLIYIDIKVNNDTLRIFTTHLQSFGFNNSDYAEMNKIKQRDEQSIEASKNIFIKMKAAFTNRGSQADIVHAQTDSVFHRSIICGDFNDVPTSYTYFHIRGNRQDAFLNNGLGVGKTYNSLAPMLRIDYILPDTSFAIKQFAMVDENLSDHVMLVSDLKLK